MKKRFLSLLLALVLCIGLLPMAANAEVAKQPAIQSTLWDNSGSANGAKTYSPGDGYHYVYFGQWKGKPIRWRVLAEPPNTYDGTSGFLLMADEIVDVVWFGRIDTDYLWVNSKAKEWCDNTFYNDAFSDLERARIAAAPATNDRGIVWGREERPNTPDNITSGPLYQEYKNILNGDHIFFPSWLDLFNTAYGFAPDGTDFSAARQTRKVAQYNYGNTKVWSYWLRSYTFDGDYHYAGMIDQNGAYAEHVPDAPSGARPMLYLNTARNKIFFASAAAGGKSAEGMDDGLTAVPSLEVDEWKLTLIDDSRDGSFQITGAYSSGDYLYLDYVGAQTGENEYVSGHIYNNGITYYGRLAKVTDGSGTVKIAKSSIPDGSLYVYNEQYNGDHRTDYVGGVHPIVLNNTTPAYDVTSALSNIQSSNTAPYTASGSEYKTTLSVTDADQYMLPADITVTVGGTALAAGTDYTYDPSTGELAIPAKKITGALHIAAEAAKKTWKISVSPEDIDFGTADYGYDEITAQTVTIQNTGNQTLTLETPALAPVTDFEMTLGSAFGANGQAVLAPNESATVTVRPKAGLGVGRYSDILEIADSTDNTGKVNEAVFLDFAVQETIVNIPDIHGVTVPVTGETPVTTITETEQYTGTVTWSPNDAAFAAGTQYTATVTLMPKDGYKLDGVPENFFTVDGAVCTNAAGSGVITAEFPALPSNSRQTHPVTIEQGKHGRLTVNRPSAPAGVTVTITASPDDGYELDDLTVVGRNGDEIDVKYEGDNQYSFRMPVGGVTIRADFTPRGQYGSFGDVARGDYFFDAVEWAAEQGIMDGVGGGLFAPHSACTRAQLVTILYRLEGSPAASANPFNDVARGSYYEKAVAWAAEHGIVTGYGDGLFGPSDRITREQLAAILYRYAQYKKLDVSVGEDTNILSYNDATRISDYAFPSMQWACGAGLLKGANSDLLPKNTATRAQMATILYRLASLLK